MARCAWVIRVDGRDGSWFGKAGIALRGILVGSICLLNPGNFFFESMQVDSLPVGRLKLGLWPKGFP